jgi:hypothetical protein
MVVLLAGLAGAGCTSYPTTNFAPAVQNVELRDDQRTQARMFLSFRGIDEQSDARVLHFRVRVESAGTETFTLQASDFELLDAALTSFGPAYADVLPLTIPPGNTATFDLAFVEPAGQERTLDLSVLSLRVRFADGRWNSTTTFERVERYAYGYPYSYPYYPNWGPAWSFHAGVAWSH